MSISRRSFLSASSTAALGAAMPDFLRRAAIAAPLADKPGARPTVLVVVQLTGGNDGLNTIIPFRNPLYAAARPTLKQPAARVLKINEELAFHPSMGGCARLLEKSQFSVLQGIGYPRPNRSHFASMDIWHKATAASDQQYGWLGRSHAQLGAGNQEMAIGGGDPPLALFGPTGFAPKVQSLAEYQLRVSLKGDDPQRRALIESFAQPAADTQNELLAMVRASARETYLSSERLRKAAREYNPPVTYPSTGLGQRLKLIAQLITAGVPERVDYTSLDGFDTHAAQQPLHVELLQEFSDAVAAFQSDIVHQGHQERVLVVSFSEFGRRVKENASEGTDHGAASQMFLVGERVRSGPIGKHPDLADLDDGDLKHHTDFLSVYATLLEDWLGVPAEPILGGKFSRLDLLKNS